MAKLGIISDTHGCLDKTALAVQLFRSQKVQEIIHCGDICDESTVRLFYGIETHFVFGNMDDDNSEELCFAIKNTANHFHNWFGSIDRLGKRIAFLHGHESDKFDQELENGNWDLLCYGHTHVAALHTQGTTLLLNPGALVRVSKPSVAIVTLPDLIVEQFSL
jgi:putative phosphoesterase